MNFVLRTAHAEEKKKRGSHKPRRTYDNNNNMKNRRCTIHVGLASYCAHATIDRVETLQYMDIFCVMVASILSVNFGVKMARTK